jgi:hypothetical protein
MEDCFLKGDDFVDGHIGAPFEGVVLFKQASEGCDGWDAADAGVHVCDIEGREYVCVGDK